jgi:glycosyltransferase involved in cell wall biosynthesis
MSVVAFDADVLGRQRTGDETYALNLLRELGQLVAGTPLRVLAVTRHPELVPEGVEPYELQARSQELRMAWTLPRALRRLGADLCHTQHALPLRAPCPCVVTVHDVSFARDSSLMSAKDRLTFRLVVPRAVRRAATVFAVSERTKADLVDLYGVSQARVVVTRNGVDPAFSPGPGAHDFVLAVGAIQARKDQLAALEAAEEVGLPLVVVGPVKDAARAEELRSRGARLEGYVGTERLAELYRGAACLVQASRYEGFGLPVVEAMASGTPVVAVPEAALEEVAGGAAVIVGRGELATGIRAAIADRERLVADGLARAKEFSWRATAERTLAVYREILGT